MRGTSARDPDAFRALVARFQGRVIALCSHLLRHPQNAEEVAQEVFFQVYRSSPDFRFESGVPTWIHRIAVNKCLNFNRDRARTDDREIRPAAWDEASVPGPARDDPEEAWLVREQRAVIRRAVADLPGRQGAMLALHHFDGRSYAEIAELMKVSVPTVESCLHRAKRNLQERLAGLLSDRPSRRKF